VEEELRRRIGARLGIEAADVVSIEEGWDSSVLEIDGEWIVRVPRREEVRPAIRLEARLLPELAPMLPVPVPRFEVVEDSEDAFFVAYRKLPGVPLDAPAEPLAAQLGAFLAALHRFPRKRATGAGVADVDAVGWLARQRGFAERCSREASPLLVADDQRRARGMFDAFLSTWNASLETSLVHADLGPAHILHHGLAVTGVIDWSDACLGDPALDFAWLLHGTRREFADALIDAYDGEREAGLRDRALFYHRLGPWHEVLFGLKHDRHDLIESGLSGIRARLP
jgi:aminoglycoside phosphotransferase (APT) family kinase protein